MTKNQRYERRGVSASKEDVHNAIKNAARGCSQKLSVKLCRITLE